MNQLAFFLVVSVLIDTFFVRTILVPCVMSSLGKANWCPLPMPVANQFLPGFKHKAGRVQ